ncbi:hypothetical protein [Mycobacterium sp. NPDC050041]|uniref:hypothetical protein n=1 Tax=Mycobacterium sp. NPDC050041 TaxID=3364293 RepID=UPI003C2D101D
MRPRAAARKVGQGWPGYLFGGRVRTSTAALLLAFFALTWVQQSFEPEPAPPPAAVVPPGFVPDPEYTWVPRTQVQEPTTTRRTTTTTTTTTTAPTETTTTDPSATTTTPTSTTPQTTVVDPDGLGPLPPQTQTVQSFPPTTPTATAPLEGPGPAPTTPAPPR